MCIYLFYIAPGVVRYDILNFFIRNFISADENPYYLRSIKPGGERVYRLGTHGAASGEHEGRLCPGAERRRIRRAISANWRPFHPKTHEEAE